MIRVTYQTILTTLVFLAAVPAWAQDVLPFPDPPMGEAVTIAYEMRTPMKPAAPAELTFWINGEETSKGTVQRTVPLVFTASETFDVGMDTASPVADAYFEKAPFEFEGTLNRLHFKYLEAE